MFPNRFHALAEAGSRKYGPLAMRLGDRASAWWLRRVGNPYAGELDAIARAAGRPGSFLLNLSFEWSCTTGVGRDPAGAGNRMLRTLD